MPMLFSKRYASTQMVSQRANVQTYSSQQVVLKVEGDITILLNSTEDLTNR